LKYFQTFCLIFAQDKESASRKNEFEAAYLIALCEHLLKQGYDPSDITVLATYTGQMHLIKKVHYTKYFFRSFTNFPALILT